MEEGGDGDRGQPLERHPAPTLILIPSQIARAVTRAPRPAHQGGVLGKQVAGVLHKQYHILRREHCDT